MITLTTYPSPKPTKSHIFPVRVYYEDTDAGGVVYHANYLKFAENGRTEWLRSTGWDHKRLAAELNVLLIVVHVEIDYRASAKLDDLIEVRSEVASIGNASLTMKQTIWRGEELLTELKIVVVSVKPGLRAVRLPPQLRQIFG